MATDGIIAVNKPPRKTSAQVLNELGAIFKASDLFADHLKAQQEHDGRMDKLNSHTRKNRRGRNQNKVKLGHGGTLDPMATGVLIAGVGRGTKRLSEFLDCTKEYEAIAIFGANTDTYDYEGKITTRKPYGHITREVVEGMLDAFRGDIMQKPPMFSALNLNGKRLYEYAREGIPIPVAIEKRPCHISNLEITKWESGADGHEWEYPALEATEVEKAAAEAYEKMGSDTPATDGGKTAEIALDPSTVDDAAFAAEKKRKLDAQANRHEKMKRRREKYNPDNIGVESSSAAPVADTDEKGETEEKAKEPTPPPPQPVYHEDVKPPVMHIKMTVSRGTYVRSVVHDIAEAAGTAAHLVALKRTRQGDYELGKNVIEWSDFVDGSGAWEEKVQKELESQRDF